MTVIACALVEYVCFPVEGVHYMYYIYLILINVNGIQDGKSSAVMHFAQMLQLSLRPFREFHMFHHILA